MKTVIIGLGNTVLSDDGAGVYVARLLSGRFDTDDVSVVEMDAAGMNLMESLGGFDRAFLIDAILLNEEIALDQHRSLQDSFTRRTKETRHPYEPGKKTRKLMKKASERIAHARREDNP